MHVVLNYLEIIGAFELSDFEGESKKVIQNHFSQSNYSICQMAASDECDEVQGCASILVAILNHFITTTGNSEGTTMSDVSHIVIWSPMSVSS